MRNEDLSKLRHDLGELSQQDLSKLLNVHPMSVSKWERGACIIPYQVNKLLDLIEDVAGYGNVYELGLRQQLRNGQSIRCLWLILDEYYSRA